MILIKKFHEDAQADKIIRDKILADFEIVKKFVKDNLYSNDVIHNTETYQIISKLYGLINEVHGFVINLNKLIELPSELLLILLSNADNSVPSRGGLGLYKGKQAIVLYCLYGVADFVFKFIVTRLDKETFLHEMIHYYDKNRYKKNIDTSMDKFMSKGGMTAYYNNPTEYNAWAQELINKIDRSIKVRKGRPDLVPKTFDDFLSLVDKIDNENWIKDLNTDYKQRFQKRLYQYYQTFVIEKK